MKGTTIVNNLKKFKLQNDQARIDYNFMPHLSKQPTIILTAPLSCNLGEDSHLLSVLSTRNLLLLGAEPITKSERYPFPVQLGAFSSSPPALFFPPTFYLLIFPSPDPGSRFPFHVSFIPMSLPITLICCCVSFKSSN